MSDIVERLRAWVYTDSLYATALEAAAEIERLRGLLSRTGSYSRQTGDDAAECHSNGEKCPERERVANYPANPESSTLTDAEREAITVACGDSSQWGRPHVATLIRLLERTR